MSLLSNAVDDATRKKLDLGPLPRGGYALTPGATSSTDNQTHGASFTMVVDTKDWDLSMFTNSPGQSGNPDSPFYKNLFDMELIGREVEKEGGLWYTLPFDKDWEAVQAAGIELGMSALRNGGLVLALFRGANPIGQVFAIGLDATETEIEAIHERLAADIVIEEFQPDRLEFIDPYHITWQIAVKPTFHTAGDFANRWLDI